MTSRSVESGEIDTDKASVRFKDVHAQLSFSNKVSFADLEHLAVRSYTFPGCMKKLTRQAVEHEIDAASISVGKHVLSEGGVTGIKDAGTRNVEGLHEISNFILISDCYIYLHKMVRH